MQPYSVIVLIGLFSFLYIWWGAAVLPGEKWQFAASVPVTKGADGSWQGLNITWYGLLTANAYLLAVVVLLFLMGGVGVPPAAIIALAVAMLAVCIPASRIVAGLVEGKSHTFTVGGAVFVGIVAAPWVVTAMNLAARDASWTVPPAASLAGFAIAYTFGEGLGRLACLSFGCCYGKPVAACGPGMQRLFRPVSLVFRGENKKIAYAGGLEGTAVVPVQLLTCLIHVLTGLFAICLFMNGHYGPAFGLSVTITQGWRFVSELLRADYRGEGRISAYQVMGIVAVVYSWSVLYFLPDTIHWFNLADGVETLWSPLVILSLQGIWVAVLLYTGISRVTAAELRFFVRKDRI